MPELFIANKNYSSWSLRPWVLMRALDIPFTERLVPFETDGRHEAFLDFSPTGKVPCLHADGLVVWESLAIVEFLADRHPGVWPDAPVARAWARSAAAEMHAGFSALRETCSMNCGVRVALHEISPALAADLARLDALLGQGLAQFGGPFLTGAAFTAADAFFAPVVFRIQTYGLQLAAPVMSWVAHMLAVPAMQAWYQAGLAETTRIAPYEVAIAQAGRLVEDLRALQAGV